VEFSVVPARIAHVERIAPRVRKVDVDEVYSATGQEIQPALENAVLTDGIHFTWMVDGRPEAMFGCSACDKMWQSGSPWLIGTDEIETYATEVLRQSKKFTEFFRKYFDLLENYVHADNITSIKWLRHCGYIVDEPVPHGLHSDLFHHFHWSR